jgi:two-component system sensor histidine kinase MtrB
MTTTVAKTAGPWTAVARPLRWAGRWLREAVLMRVVHWWRRSLLLRVAATTAAVSGVVVVIIGVVLLGQISGGLLDAKRHAALAEADEGLRTATDQLAVLGGQDNDSIRNSLRQLVATLSAKGSNAGLFDVVLIAREGGFEPVVSGKVDPNQVPQTLISMVAHSQQGYVYGQIVREGGSPTTGLIIGEPLASPIGDFGLYYLFPLETEQHTLELVRRTVLVAGLVLVLLIVLIAALVTRQVVLPVRHAAKTAERFAFGHLEERMRVRGEDDLARLASSFNEMAASLQQQIDKLEEFSRLQRRFTSDVSHELRTPLTTVRMAADTLYDSREDLPRGLDRASELLHKELDRFESLLTDLLEISRHDAQAAELAAEPVDLRGTVIHVMEAVVGLAVRAGSDMILWTPPEPVVAEIDTPRVERILRNLLGNALEHGEGLGIEVIVAGSDDAVAVTVRDHGVGFTDEEAALVFNRFWRGDPSRARHTGGTGLGLAISLEDARLHNGSLDAWGNPGKGAMFRLTLPRKAGREFVESPLPLGSVETRELVRGLDSRVFSVRELRASVRASEQQGDGG